MKLLTCLVCDGEVEVIGNETSINKKIKCLQCGFTNLNEKTNVNEPEVFFTRKRK